MFTITVILTLFALSVQVLPVALGIEFTKDLAKSIWFGIIIVLVQLLFFLFGYFLGERLIHLIEDFKGTVVFAGFFLIGIRMMMDAFKVRRGERTFTIESTLQVALASSAPGINTFLAGLLFTCFVIDTQWLTSVLSVLIFLLTGLGMVVKPGQQSLVAISLLFAIGGLIMLISSVYLGFIY